MVRQEFVKRAMKLISHTCTTIKHLSNTYSTPLKNFFNTILTPIKKAFKAVYTSLFGQELYDRLANTLTDFKTYLLSKLPFIERICKRVLLYMAIAAYTIFVWIVKLLTIPITYINEKINKMKEADSLNLEKTFLWKVLYGIKYVFNSIFQDIRNMWENHPLTVSFYVLAAVLAIGLYSYVMTTIKLYIASFAVVSLIPYLLPLI